jgi:hypothetical protein
MSVKKWIVLAVVLAGLVLSVGLAVQASPPGQQPGPQGGVRAQGSLGTAASTVLNTSFTYQGQLKSGGQPVDGSCDIDFRLYDAGTGGSQVGSAVVTTVPVVDGLFTVNLDFGSGVFSGDARWLGIQVKCSGDAAYVNLGRQALTATPYALYAASAWQVGGNAGTTPGVDYLGTSDGVTLTLAVNGAAALRLVPDADSPNVVGGHGANSVAAGVAGATIGGGGYGAGPNRVTADYATIAGGRGNAADGYVATVGGGRDNTASGSDATVGGGLYNTASGWAATVAGGLGNTASGWEATVGGGEGNVVTATYATVAGGQNNVVTATHATVGGGYGNAASYDYATVGGGRDNTARGSYTTVGGGWANAASNSSATVGGGRDNTASGVAATVAGGYLNTAGGNYSFAAGRRAKANNQGCFVWGDSTTADVACNVNDRWVARTSGGVYFYTDSGLSKGVYVAADGGSWSSVSDRNVKENLERVDPQQVLERVAQIPLSTWNFIGQEDGIRHMGPMAQDLYAAFGLGDSERHINSLDADGVALAAVQGLYELSQEQAATIETLAAENSALAQQVDALAAERVALQRQLDALNARVEAIEAGSLEGTAPLWFLQNGMMPGAGIVLVGLGLAWLKRRGIVLFPQKVGEQ